LGGKERGTEDLRGLKRVETVGTLPFSDHVLHAQDEDSCGEENAEGGTNWGTEKTFFKEKGRQGGEKGEQSTQKKLKRIKSCVTESLLEINQAIGGRGMGTAWGPSVKGIA